jgi:hypothetical protein
MSDLANLDSLEDPPLGIKDPLLPPPTLGQTSFLQPKFLFPNVNLLALDEFDAPDLNQPSLSKVISATPPKLQPQITTKAQLKTKPQQQTNLANLTRSAIAPAQTTIPEVQASFTASKQTDIATPTIEENTKSSDADPQNVSPSVEDGEVSSTTPVSRKMPEIQRKFLESQQKNIPSISDPQNKSIPTLPSVLQNISHIQTSLSNRKNLIIGSGKSTAPDCWNSIDDLIGSKNGSKTSSSDSSVIQRSPESATSSSWSSVAELLLSSSTNPNPSGSNTDTSPIMRKAEVHFRPQVFPSNIPTKIQKYTAHEISSESIPDVSVSSIHEPKDETWKASPRDLEMLAQEIYCLLKQRIQIERERQGGNYFGQLPW